jgi:hypothetical protein
MNEQTIKTIHNTYAYYTSFFLFRIQNENCGSGVGSTKKEKEKRKVKRTNGKHEERREH